MKRTYVMVNGEFVERKRDRKGRYHYVMPDIAPYKSMIDGRMITSRSQHRAHLRANNCVEVGNDDPTRHIKREAPRNNRREVLRHIIGDMRQSDLDRIVNRAREDLRFRRS